MSPTPLKSCIFALQHGKCNITTLLTVVVFFQIYLLFQNYHASQYLEAKYFQEQHVEMAKSTDNEKVEDLCEPRNDRLFPLCESKFKYLSLAHGQDCFKNVHGVDGSKCSIMRYLQEVEPFCMNHKPKLLRSDRLDVVSIREDLGGLLRKMSIENFDWVRERARKIWPDIIESIKTLKNDRHFLQGPRKKLLFFLGSMGFQPNILKRAGRGGFVGELIQWTDVITTSYVLGHDVTVVVKDSDLKPLFISEKNGCASKFISRRKEFDLIFTDLNGNIMLHEMLHANHARIRCKLRILDSFGTEAEFNNGAYDEKIPGGRSPWGNADLILGQFFTFFPHSPDNTFLGFIAGKIENNKAIRKKDIAVIYGKLNIYLPAYQAYLETIKDYFEIHATMKIINKDVPLPSYVINHGVLSEVKLKKLLKEAKLFIGLGFPFEGPGALDAIANGAVFLNPLFTPPKNKLNDFFFKMKPTLRKVTSQNPYMEDFVGKPYVYTIDIYNMNQLVAALKEIKAAKNFKPFLPREFTAIGMVERLHALIQHQDFCHPDAPRWPPLKNLEIFLAPLGKSCKNVCRSKGRICEPSYFSDINNVNQLQKLGTTCKEKIFEKKLHHPSYDPSTNACYFQKDILYFSCVAESSDVHRVCPCRNFMKGQTALCVGCL